MNDKSVQPERIDREQVIEAPQTRLVLDKGMIGLIKKASTTPDVKNVEHWKAQNTVPVSVTNFLNGQPAQHLYIEGDDFTTLAHGTLIKLNGGVNLLLAVNKIYHLVRRDSKWIEEGQLPQMAAIANATDNPSAITQLNELLTKLRAIGVLAT